MKKITKLPDMAHRGGGSGQGDESNNTFTSLTFALLTPTRLGRGGGEDNGTDGVGVGGGNGVEMEEWIDNPERNPRSLSLNPTEKSDREEGGR